MKNDKGFALVAAMVVMSLLLALGGAAMTMSSLGYLALSSDRKYQLANWAADHAINGAVKYAVDKAACPPAPESGTVGSKESPVNWTYFAVPAAASQYCFIHAKGNLGSTLVVKTLVVPKTAKFGGLVTRGGSITLKGVATAIAGCDTTDTASCGIMPGVITSTALTGDFGTKPATTCASNPIGGLVGSPPFVVEDRGDLFANYFDVTDPNGDGNFWDGMQAAIAAKYGITMPPSVQSPPASISPSCRIESSSDKKCCKTTSTTKIECYNSTDCSGSPLSGAGFSIDLAASGCSQIEVRPLEFRIQNNVGNIIIFADKVTVNSSITGTSISASGDVNVNALATNSQIVSAQNVAITTSTTNTSVFANNITFNIGSNTTIAGGCGASSPNPCPDPSKAGGTFYSNNNITLSGNGNINYGTDADPLIMLAGNRISAEGTGNSTIRGLLATNGTGLNITGSYEIKGAIINNSTSANLTNTGNADIKFNMGILREVFNQFSYTPGYPSGYPLKEPTCGGGNIFSTVKNTKMTAY